jgi:hypothetical protein
VRRPQLDDVSGQLGLERPGLAAARRRPARCRVDATGRLAPRPLARRLVHASRDAAARGEQRLDRYRPAQSGGSVEAGDQAHGIRVERLEHDRLARLQPRQRGRLLARGQHQHGQAGERVAERAQRGMHIGGRTIGVVDHQQRRTPRIPRARDRDESGLRRARPDRVQHRRSLAVGAVRELGGDPSLAHPVPADQRHEPPGARGGPLPVRAQPAQLTVAPGQRRRRRGVELSRQLGHGRLDVQHRVLAQDRVVQAPQLRARLDPDLLHQRAACVHVGLERLGLAPAPIQREHPLRVQPLAQRVPGQQRLDLANDLAMAPGGQVRVDRQLRGRLAQLLEPADLRRRERLVRQVRERVAAEQRQRLARRVPRLPRRGRAARLGD